MEMGGAQRSIRVMDVMHIDFFFFTPHLAGTKKERVGVGGREGAAVVCLRKMTF